MSVTSKTGLLPTLKRKKLDRGVPAGVTLELPKLVVPAPFSLKPFAGIYNPFPYGCSILCNHPTDFEAKSIVKKAKDAWATEGKSLLDLEELSVLRLQEKIKREPQSLPPDEEKDDNVPEELFRKYTDTDSRPITPTPTLASIVTKNLRTRRCVTPDPTSFIPAKEKTFLVLDLRRSHSQQTVFWQSHLDDTNFDNNLRQEVVSRATTPPSPSPAQIKKKKTQKKKTGSTSATVSSLKSQTSKDSDSKVLSLDLQSQRHSLSQSPSRESGIREQEMPNNIEIPPEDPSDDLNAVKRRGKRPKKGKKGGKGEKEFQGIPDPGETQVSALENDSNEGSSRQSPTGEEKQIEENLINSEPRRELQEQEEESKSFLSRDTLKRLQRQLDQEVVDSEQNVQRKIALEEALRCKKNPRQIQQGEEMKSLKKEFQSHITDSEKWLSIPRVFTRKSARFELPMDSRILNDLTPMEYIEKYVFVSTERVVLYNHIFNIYKEDPEDDEERERVILGKNVVEALGKVMGRVLTTQEAHEFKHLLGWKDETNMGFRTFAGICAACERLMSPRFCSKMATQKEDPRHEIEQADFESLNGKLLRLNPDRSLVRILKSIRDT